MLAVLKHHEIYLGIVSNKHGKYLRREVTHLGWDSYFGATVGAHDAPRDKPATDAVDLALAGSPVPSGQSVWFVGDTEIDMECAINAGCIPVLVHKTPAESKAFQAFPPALHVINCLALSNAVQGL